MSGLRIWKRLVVALGMLAGLAACEEGHVEEFVVVEPVSEEPVFLDAIPHSPPPVIAKRGGVVRPRQGVVTAGDIDDTLNLAAFQRYQARTAKELKLPKLNLQSVFAIQIVDAAGKPAPGTLVTLSKPGASDPFYTGYAGVDGRLSVFPHALGAGRVSQADVAVFGKAKIAIKQRVKANSLARIAIPGSGGSAPDFLDLVFVIDVSGSMGDELAWLTKEFQGLVGQIKQAAPGADLRFGLIAYQSPGDPFVVKNFGFTERPKQMQRWLRTLEADGGSGGAEVVGRALMAAVDLPWRRGLGERLVFQIGDEPPSKQGARLMLEATRKAAARNVQVFGLAASGVEDQLEYLLRQAAVMTNGRYLFLTDDSGIGNAHAEPKIACYRVTRLKSLLTRVLRSELTGLRIEAPEGEVIRTVGAYDRGVCKN